LGWHEDREFVKEERLSLVRAQQFGLLLWLLQV
jgi:hypothetical protein